MPDTYDDDVFSTVVMNIGRRLIREYGERRGKAIMLPTTDADTRLRLKFVVTELKSAMEQGAEVSAAVCKRIGIAVPETVPATAVLQSISITDDGAHYDVEFSIDPDDIVETN